MSSSSVIFYVQARCQLPFEREICFFHDVCEMQWTRDAECWPATNSRVVLSTPCWQAGPVTCSRARDMQQQLSQVLECSALQSPALGQGQSLGVVGVSSDMERPYEGASWLSPAYGLTCLFQGKAYGKHSEILRIKSICGSIT